MDLHNGLGIVLEVYDLRPADVHYYYYYYYYYYYLVNLQPISE